MSNRSSHRSSVRWVARVGVACALAASACRHGAGGTEGELLAAAPDASLAEGAAAPCDPVVCELADDPTHPASMAELVIESGGAAMNGVVYVPPGPGPHPVVVLLHGFPGNERNGDLAHALRRAGFVVVAFSYRGTWGSGGDFSFSGILDDVDAAIDHVATAPFVRANRSDPARISLVGHSMGGFAALQGFARRAEVACGVSLAGANLGMLGGAAKDPAVRAQIAERFRNFGGPVRLAPDHDLGEELAAHAGRFDTRSLASRMAGRPVLLVAAARDEVAAPAVHHDPLVAALEAAGATRLASHVLPADHAFSSERLALSRLVVDWLGRSCR
jgi:uncharacterized protein